MASRGLLHLKDVEGFATWLEGRGWHRAATKGEWEVLRVVHPKRSKPLIVYNKMTEEHASFEDQYQPLIWQYLREKRAPFNLAGTIRALLEKQIPWSTKTFGPGARVGGITKHIEKELDEIRANPTDLVEWVDVILLALDGAWRAGYTAEQIVEALFTKQARNFTREWPAPTDENTTSEHLRRV